jgi:hypothetical protein
MMRFPPELSQELEPFIRWMAITPQIFKEYQATPEAVMRTARLSPEASDWLLDAGLRAVIELVRTKFDEIIDDPASWRRSEFTRDRSIQGYGGVIKSSKPD